MEGHPNIVGLECWPDEGLSLKDLKPNTVLSVETRNSIYKVKIIDGRRVEIMGGMLKDGTDRFPAPVPAVILGSTFGGSMIKLDWIGYQMYMEVHLQEDRKGQIFTTSSIQNVMIEPPDGSWTYSLDWNK